MSRPAGVGNNDIESSESLHRVVDDACAGFGARDVGDDEAALDVVRVRDLLAQNFGGSLVGWQAVDADVNALRAQTAGDDGSKTGCTAGDDGTESLKTMNHFAFVMIENRFEILRQR